jgi:hypothetical protein
MRETPRIMGFFSGYQIAALVVTLLESNDFYGGGGISRCSSSPKKR